MYILNTPFTYTTFSQLGPDDIDKQFRLAKRQLNEVSGRRFHEVVFPINIDGMTNTMTDAQRRFRFRPTQTTVVTRAWFYGKLTSSDPVRVRVFETLSPSTVPPGATSPILQTPSAASAESQTDFSPSAFILSAGTEYTFRLETAVTGGTFTVDYGQIVLHCRTDRYNLDGADETPSFSYTPTAEESAPTAATVNGTVANLASAVTAMQAENAPMPVTFQCRGLTNVSGPAVSTFNIPRFDEDLTQPRYIRRIDAYIEFAASTSGIAQVEIKDSIGSVLSTTTLTISAATSANNGGSVSIYISDPTNGISADAAEDYSIEFSQNIVAASVRFYATLWIDN